MKKPRPKYKEKFEEADNTLDSILDTLKGALILTAFSYDTNSTLLKRVQLVIKQIEMYQEKQK